MIKGIHHVSLSAAGTEGLKKALGFYNGLLGLPVIRDWGRGVMLDAGNCIIEIMSTGSGEETKGLWGHIAFLVDNTDTVCEKLRRAGYTVTMEPCDKDLNGYPVRICFCIGPCGEEIELFMERQ